jgi:hypothetical protein
VLRGITKNAVRDARLAEIKREIVASERLKVWHLSVCLALCLVV